jgi:glycosyltransferase involved in cell wall biosynthesis
MEWFPECQGGGLERYFHEMVHAFSAEGVEGKAMVSSSHSSRVGSIEVNPFAPKGASLLRRWNGAAKSAGLALEGGVDAVNTHFALNAVSWVRKIPGNVPLIVNFHGPWAQEMTAQSGGWKARVKSILSHRIEQKVYRRADRVITLSKAFRDLIHQSYGVPLSTIQVIPGGSNLEPYLAAPERQEARRRLGWPENRPILLSVRRLARRMGLELLVDAVALLKRDFPDLLLFLAGKGPEADSLQKRICEMGVGENVRLLGFVSEKDLPLAYAAANCSVVPTVALEGFGLITVESLASGTPVLGTPVSGTPEILEPLAPQLLFAEVSAESMAQKIGSVIRRETVLPDREECRRYARRYGWPEVMPRLMATYREAIKECRGR